MSAPNVAAPTAVPQPPSPSLAQLLGADDVRGVLAYLRQDGIVNDPDARLQVLTEVVAHITAAAQPSGPKSDGPSASHHGMRWKWADVVMRGVTDPWSRIRALSTPVMADLLQAEVDLVLQRQQGRKVQQQQPQPQRGGNSYSNSSTAASSLSCDGGGDGARAAAAPLPCEEVSKPLAYMWERWRAATLWYEQDGVVRTLAKLYNRSGTRAGDALRTDEVGLRSLLTHVLFPALRNAQLPVRESAALTIGLLADSRRHSTLPPGIVSLMVSHVANTLAETPAPLRRHAPASSVAVENTRVLEGNLLALNELVEAGAVAVESGEMMPLLLRLSSYPASSVRQYVAQILRPPSVSVFAYLMQRLCEHHDCMPQRADGDGTCSSSSGSESTAGSRDADGAEEELSWQRLETVMMALHQHLLYLHSSGNTMKDLLAAASDTKAVLTPSIFATSLSVAFKATHSPRFEVARMGKQLFPLHLQMSLRFAPPSALPCICEDCCGATGCVQQELRRLAESGATARLAAARRYVGSFVVAAMWWFLTLRRITAEVVGGSNAAPPTTGAPVETRAGVEEMVLPYATLDRVRAAVEVQHVDGEGGHDAAAAAAAAAAFPSCLTALLPLTAYFAAAMDPHEWHRCVGELLAPSFWAAALADPEQRELARFGPDFVRAVHHRGTAAEMHRLVGLIPTLVAAARNAPPHLQCLLVAMLRVAVVAHTAGSSAAEERAMGFVYHGAYTAPALVEGGDAVPLGHVWLKYWVPTQEGIPTAVLWGDQPAEPLRESVILVEDNSDVFEAIEKTCYRELYRSPQTEPVVLRELRALMISLSRPGIGTPSGKHVDWYAAALAAVFRRLEKVCPEWQATIAAACETSGTGGDGDEDDEGGAECWDDDGDCWDDDSDDDVNGAAQGIYAAEEVRNAAAVVWALRERVTVWMDAADVRAAEEPYRSKLDVFAASSAMLRGGSGGSS